MIDIFLCFIWYQTTFFCLSNPWKKKPKTLNHPLDEYISVANETLTRVVYTKKKNETTNDIDLNFCFIHYLLTRDISVLLERVLQMIFNFVLSFLCNVFFLSTTNDSSIYTLCLCMCWCIVLNIMFCMYSFMYFIFVFFLCFLICQFWRVVFF